MGLVTLPFDVIVGGALLSVSLTLMIKQDGLLLYFAHSSYTNQGSYMYNFMGKLTSKKQRKIFYYYYDTSLWRGCLDN